jgi:hypothetical protein
VRSGSVEGAELCASVPLDMAERGSDHAIQFSGLEHRDHCHHGGVLQVQVDAGVLASELAEIGSDRLQMLAGQRNAEAQRAELATGSGPAAGRRPPRPTVELTS